MKSLRTFVCLAGSVALFGTGCGAPPEEPGTQPEQTETGEVEQQSTSGVLYNICWPALGLYNGPGTNYSHFYTLYHANGDQFLSDSEVFPSNGDYWIRGSGIAWSRNVSYYGYVRWNGLCH